VTATARRVEQPERDPARNLATTVVRPSTPDERVVKAPDRPRQVSARTADDWLCLIGAAIASLCLVWLLFTGILPFSGKLGFVLCWYVAFVGLYAGVTALSQPQPIVVDRIASAIVHGGAAAAGLALASTVTYTFVKGWPAYSHLNFFTQTMKGVGPTAPMSQGGILHAIVGSLVEVGIAVVASVPLAIATAVYMTEVGGRFSRIVRTVIEAMTALPDLVAGLFVYAVLIVGLGNKRTGIAAALALSITMLPIIARSSEVVLRNVPAGLREAAYALGAPQWRSVLRVILPTALPGLATALILGIARGIGETAPVIITSGASTYFNADPFHDPMNSLPLYIYTSIRNASPQSITRGYGAASVLLAVVVVLFALIRLLARGRGNSR
jgi:phosphate transport system permease protein